MGQTVLTLEIGNIARPDATEPLDFLIDSGAVYSVVPSPVLERLHVEPFTEQEFRLADGSKIVRRRGAALFKQKTSALLGLSFLGCPNSFFFGFPQTRRDYYRKTRGIYI